MLLGLGGYPVCPDGVRLGREADERKGLRLPRVIGITRKSSAPDTEKKSGVCVLRFSNQRKRRYFMERVMGIEPTLSAWEAEVLPLNYTRFKRRAV